MGGDAALAKERDLGAGPQWEGTRASDGTSRGNLIQNKVRL